MYLALVLATLASTPITIDAGVVVQVEVAIIGGLCSLILKKQESSSKRLTTIEATLDGPKGNGGLERAVEQIEKEILATGRLRLRTVTDYISWRRRVETTLKKIDPSFELTPDHTMLDLLCGEDPE
jgi:hypothetical protein